MSQQNAVQPNPTSTKSHRSGPNGSQSVRGWLGFAKARTRLAPQRDKTMASYDKALLSRQVARDLERIEDFIVNLVSRGMPLWRALTVTLGVLAERVRQRVGGVSAAVFSIAEIHQAEEDAEGPAESAECAFVHDPRSLAKAMAFLDADAAYMATREPLIELARKRVAEG